MASNYGIEGSDVNNPQSTSQDDLQELGMLNQDKKHFPFLRLPAEIRNAIYRDLVYAHAELLDLQLLLNQPPITRVNRQTRAEALPRYYQGHGIFLVENNSSDEWVPLAQKAVDAYTGGSRGLPGGYQSTLRHLGHLQLDFLILGTGIHIEFDLMENPKDVLPPDPNDSHEVVVVGTPGMDWTDATAVQAACDEAAVRLANDMTKRTTIVDNNVALIAFSTPVEQRAAVEAMHLFAVAFPRLRPSICVSDTSSIYEVQLPRLQPWMVQIMIEQARAESQLPAEI